MSNVNGPLRRLTFNTLPSRQPTFRDVVDIFCRCGGRSRPHSSSGRALDAAEFVQQESGPFRVLGDLCLCVTAVTLLFDMKPPGSGARAYSCASGRRPIDDLPERSVCASCKPHL